MLRQLRIHQLVLIDHADITFGNYFNVLSGETGSGKSAILGALHLITGGKADPQLVRRGEQKGVVEALFDIDSHSEVKILLEQAGIEIAADEDLIIRREVHAGGKSRAFVNNRLVSLSMLQQISPFLIDIVSQHANVRLLQLEYHRRCLDAFAESNEILRRFQCAWEVERGLGAELDEWMQQEAARLREIEVCRMEVEELSEARIEEGEEEELFAEYSRLANSDTLQRLSGSVSSAIFDGKHAILSRLSSERNGLEQLAKLDSSVEETASAMRSVLLEVEEIGRTMRDYHARIEQDPRRLAEVNERLALINRLKRKFGPTATEIRVYLEERKERLHELENADQKIEELQHRLTQAREETAKEADALSQMRREAAARLGPLLTNELTQLNMPNAELKVEVSRVARTIWGEDEIELFLAPNRGERFISLREGISGGEIARVMLSLKQVLAGRDQVGTLVFDEIDANIGGTTATVIGEKLRDISRRHQLLCITHFPQVARFADHHLYIAKQEEADRTITRVRVLEDAERSSELVRMSGGSSK